MEHANKLVLLSRESVELLQNSSSNLCSSQTPGTIISRLDVEINRTLNSDEKDDREKWKCYHRVLQRFLYFKDADNKK